MSGVGERCSALYVGTVTHRRTETREHAFSSRVRMLYLDLGEVHELLDHHPLWSARRPAPGWFRRRDYLGDPAVPLAEATRRLVAERTGAHLEGPVRVLTTPRCLGHGFNPVSFYYCFDAAGAEVLAVVAEVTNTPWGERHCYVARCLTSRHVKALHVSPFFTLAYEYELRIGIPSEQLAVAVIAERDGRRAFTATLALTRAPLDARALTRYLLAGPPSIKVSTAIYAQALRLRLKGVPMQPHPRRATRRAARRARS